MAMTTTDRTTTDFPGVVSVDDHTVEPADLWTSRLPAKYRDAGPRVVREKIARQSSDADGAKASIEFDVTASKDGDWADIWVYEDKRRPILLLSASVGHPHDEMDFRATTYDDMRPGCYDPKARVADMDMAGVEASLCFPNMEPVRFCGQGFLEGKDKDLSLLCVRAYNDWMLDEWCGPSSGRLVPLGIIPLWDAQLAADEIRRTAARGMRAICFSEAPAFLGLPSIHTDYWDPVFRACEETSTVLMIHIGSSSRLTMPSDDAPLIMGTALLTNNVTMTLVDWMFSGVFERFSNLKVALAECQIGWVPYFLQISDEIWDLHKGLTHNLKITRSPSSYFRTNMYVSAFNDNYGLHNLDWVGVDQVLLETDYPHSQTTWPDSKSIIQQQCESAGLDRTSVEKITRGNARKLFRLD